ncbi:FtsX-like permease family protein [Porphyromonas sp. oral taxon 275]|uniref:FtsX-like permease family protein n=1 Tax=Porphyromonas sp. oral taxon 275 TaxID=712435 RepID=UPI001BA6B6E3|nr:FtsX-like permease family protein [Porphyromonas sp. oral taxon 275]QUB42536.1 ABC transporter permease [Porphyromonas sp. oral taxon 275]
MNALLLRLLKRHISPAQLLGFVLANLIGLGILLLGLQFYRDALTALSAKDSLMRADYLIISKQVSSGLFGSRDNSFSAEEIADLEQQPFVAALGRFTPSKFQVSAGLGLGSALGGGLSTYMFLEAVPDRFLDLKPSDWHWEEGQQEVPLIIPRSYLGLYNSAFAQSQGLPLLSEATIGAIPLGLELRGGLEEQHYRGRIVGFSNRLNTLLVPEHFIQQMNRRLAPELPASPTRLILELHNPSDPAIALYLREHSYESEGERLASSQSMYFLRLLSGVVLGVGLLISALSAYLLLLSIYLLLQKNSRQLENLLLLGYSQRQLVLPYVLLTLVLNLLALLAALGLVLWVRGYYLEAASRLVPEDLGASLLPTLLLGLGLLVGTTLVNAVAIGRKVRSLRAFARR